MTTPSQAAKEYAAANGFTITPTGRRYTLSHKAERAGVPELWATDVGGYPAALNAMKARIESLVVESDLQASAAEAIKAFDSHEVDHADMLNDPERTAGVSPQHRAETALDVATRNKLVYGDERGMKGVDFPAVVVDFLDFNAESKTRIRRLARRASGKPPGGPWHVIFDGSTVMRYGYPSRAEAIAVVRRGLNHPEPHIRNNWRTKPVTLEYRP